MARSFTAADLDTLSVDTAVVSNEPFTMACWAQTTSATVRHTVMWLGDKDNTVRVNALDFAGDIAGDPIRAFSFDGTNNGIASTSTGFSINTWHHLCGVWSATNARAAFLDGAGKGTDTTSVSVGGEDRTAIGYRGDSTPSNYLNGQVAEAAVWNVALSDGEVAILAKGFSPRFVRPTALVAYWPLMGRFAPEIDVVGRVDLAVTGADPSAHPRVFYPMQPYLIGRGTIAAAAGQAPRSMHQFRMRRVG